MSSKSRNPAWLTAMFRAALPALLLAPLLACAQPQGAPPNEPPDEPPARVGRLAEVQGSVWLYDTERDQWTAAERNSALTGGDRLSTDRDGRAELRIGSTVLRLDGGSELELRRLDDEAMHFRLSAGSLALRVQVRELAEQIEVATVDGRFLPRRAGHYRIDRERDSSVVSVWTGDLHFEGRENALPVGTGERIVVWASGARWERSSSTAWRDDAFAAWVLAADRRDQEWAAAPQVSPELTGAEELDRHGRWDRHPEFGLVWWPAAVPVGWAPYRHGRWMWRSAWGWTWIDAAPWGFATSHYGRWVLWGGRWVWWPGAHALRPVFAPALVVWAGSPQVGVSVVVGGPGVGWAPLPPRAVPVRPVYPRPRHDVRARPDPRHPPHHDARQDRRHDPRQDRRHDPRQDPRYGARQPPQVPTGPIMRGGGAVPRGPSVATPAPRELRAQRPEAPTAPAPAVTRALPPAMTPAMTPALTPAMTPARPPAAAVVPGGATSSPPESAADPRRRRVAPSPTVEGAEGREARGRAPATGSAEGNPRAGFDERRTTPEARQNRRMRDAVQ
jgi:hypothetical protein